MSKPKTHTAICKKYFEDSTYLLSDMMEDSGQDLQACLDLLYDYKEAVFGEVVDNRHKVR
jgi:hypothetical protein